MMNQELSFWQWQCEIHNGLLDNSHKAYTSKRMASGELLSYDFANWFALILAHFKLKFMHCTVPCCVLYSYTRTSWFGQWPSGYRELSFSHHNLEETLSKRLLTLAGLKDSAHHVKLISNWPWPLISDADQDRCSSRSYF